MILTIIFTEDNFISNYYESVVSKVIDTSYQVARDYENVKEIINNQKWLEKLPAAQQRRKKRFCWFLVALFVTS